MIVDWLIPTLPTHLVIVWITMQIIVFWTWNHRWVLIQTDCGKLLANHCIEIMKIKTSIILYPGSVSLLRIWLSWAFAFLAGSKFKIILPLDIGVITSYYMQDATLMFLCSQSRKNNIRTWSSIKFKRFFTWNLKWVGKSKCNEWTNPTN